MRRTTNRSGLDSDEDVDLPSETPEHAAEWAGENREGDIIMTIVNMQI